MPRLLVAEDSPTQIVFIRGLLEEADFEVDAVVNGKEAIGRLDSGEKYDLVLTDMMMPVLDGLQLVRAIRVHYSGTPVILMTGQGTDAIAIEALEDGAAGYVPKSQLHEKLINEVSQVLHATEVDRSYEILLGCLKRNQFEFELRNDVSLIDPLMNLVMQMMAGVKLCDSTSQMRVGLALEHALLNAIYRGNLEISAEDMQNSRESLLEGDSTTLVDRRIAEEPYASRRVHLEIEMSTDAVQFTIRDEGPGFDTSRVPRSGDPDVLEQEGSHGLLLMQTFMDEVTFNASGNQVTMIKRRET